MNHLMANWPAPANIGALTTTITGGMSLPPYASNNLALHVGDNEHHVQANRQALVQSLQLPGEPIWLEQTHSNRCVIVEHDHNRVADAAITRSATHPLAILTADCLPILLCADDGSEIAAIHAGWRGLLNGIVENTLTELKRPMARYLAWIGPAICQTCFEVGDEVREAFTNRYSFAHLAFDETQGTLHANLPKLAELILQAYGVSTITQSNICTVESKNKFYSYRRAANTGRMVSLIWLKDK